MKQTGGGFTPRSVVLFLCTHNAAHSQMAEGFLKHYAGDRFEVHSAGMEPRDVNPLAVQVMAEVGIDISGQASKSPKVYLGHLTVDHAIFVCQHAEVACPTIWPFGGRNLRWPFDDPAAPEATEGAQLEKFRTIRDQIDSKIKQWLVEV